MFCRPAPQLNSRRARSALQWLGDHRRASIHHVAIGMNLVPDKIVGFYVATGEKRQKIRNHFSLHYSAGHSAHAQII